MEDKELIEQADKIRKGFSSVMEDEEEEQLSFLDEINSLVRIIFKDAPVDVYTVLKEGELEKWKKQKYRRLLKKLLGSISIRGISYFILLVTITGFLVSEALPFYAVAGVIGTKTYIKAILTEVCFIFLSGYRCEGKLETVAVGVLRASIFCLMLFVITSATLTQGTNKMAEITNLDAQVRVLEKQIDSKEKEIQFYMDKDWGSNARQRILERDELSEKLMKLKQSQVEKGASKEASELVKYKMYGKAIFRLILMFISVLLTRRIFRF